MKILDLTKQPPDVPSCWACIYSAEDGFVCRRNAPTHVSLIPEDEAFAAKQGHYYVYPVDEWPSSGGDGWCGDGCFMVRYRGHATALYSFRDIWRLYVDRLIAGMDLSPILGPME